MQNSKYQFQIQDHDSSMKNILRIIVIFCSITLAGGCLEGRFGNSQNLAEKAEIQKERADMVIMYDRPDRFFVEKPLMNVKNGIQHPFSLEELEKVISGARFREETLVVILGRSWSSSDDSSIGREADKLQSLFKEHFHNVIIQQEQAYSFNRILKE
jgi:hypothetical protein